MPFTEANFENAILHLVEALGYTRLYGPDIARDYRNPLYMDALTQSLPRVNPGADAEALREALHKLTHVEHGELVSQNRRFMDWLQNGVEVSYQKGGETKNALVRLVDFAHEDNNAFHVINQWTVAGGETKRPDVVVFINGLPIVNDRPTFGRLPPVPLDDYYRENVIGGDGSFMIVAEDFESFGVAVKRKLIREISDIPPQHRDARRRPAGTPAAPAPPGRATDAGPEPDEEPDEEPD